MPLLSRGSHGRRKKTEPPADAERSTAFDSDDRPKSHHKNQTTTLNNFFFTQSPFNVDVVPRPVVEELVFQICEDLKARAINTPYFLLSYREQTDNSKIRTFIDNVFAKNKRPLTGDALLRLVRNQDPYDLAGALKWCWCRIPGGIVTWKAYNKYREEEEQLGSPPPLDAFFRIFPNCVESDHHMRLVVYFFEFVMAMATHGRANGMGETKLPRLAGTWAFEVRRPNSQEPTSFADGLAAWSQAAEACNHLFFAYLRWLASSAQFKLSKPLANLFSSINGVYPPPPASVYYTKGIHRLVHVPMITLTVGKLSSNPLVMLRRVAKTIRFDDSSLFYSEDDFNTLYMIFSDPNNIEQKLTKESLDILYKIGDENSITDDHPLLIKDTWKLSYDLRARTWSKYYNHAFVDCVTGELKQPLNNYVYDDKQLEEVLKVSVPSQEKDGHLPYPVSPDPEKQHSRQFQELSKGDGGYDKCNRERGASRVSSGLNWDKFAKYGFDRPYDQDQAASNAAVALASKRMSKYTDSLVTAAVSKVAIDDFFVWVWMSTLSEDQTEVRKATFGRSVIMETMLDDKTRRWVVVEEALSPAPKPMVAPYSTDEKENSDSAVLKKKTPFNPSKATGRRAVSTPAESQIARRRSKKKPIDVKSKVVRRPVQTPAALDPLAEALNDRLKKQSLADAQTQTYSESLLPPENGFPFPGSVNSQNESERVISNASKRATLPPPPPPKDSQSDLTLPTVRQPAPLDPQISPRNAYSRDNQADHIMAPPKIVSSDMEPSSPGRIRTPGAPEPVGSNKALPNAPYSESSVSQVHPTIHSQHLSVSSAEDDDSHSEYFSPRDMTDSEEMHQEQLPPPKNSLESPSMSERMRPVSGDSQDTSQELSLEDDEGASSDVIDDYYNYQSDDTNSVTHSLNALGITASSSTRSNDTLKRQMAGMPDEHYRGSTPPFVSPLSPSNVNVPAVLLQQKLLPSVPGLNHFSDREITPTDTNPGVQATEVTDIRYPHPGSFVSRTATSSPQIESPHSKPPAPGPVGISDSASASETHISSLSPPLPTLELEEQSDFAKGLEAIAPTWKSSEGTQSGKPKISVKRKPVGSGKTPVNIGNSEASDPGSLSKHISTSPPSETSGRFASTSPQKSEVRQDIKSPGPQVSGVSSSSTGGRAELQEDEVSASDTMSDVSSQIISRNRSATIGDPRSIVPGSGALSPPNQASRPSSFGQQPRNLSNSSISGTEGHIRGNYGNAPGFTRYRGDTGAQHSGYSAPNDPRFVYGREGMVPSYGHYGSSARYQNMNVPGNGGNGGKFQPPTRRQFLVPRNERFQSPDSSRSDASYMLGQPQLPPYGPSYTGDTPKRRVDGGPDTSGSEELRAIPGPYGGMAQPNIMRTPARPPGRNNAFGSDWSSSQAEMNSQRNQNLLMGDIPVAPRSKYSHAPLGPINGTRGPIDGSGLNSALGPYPGTSRAPTPAAKQTYRPSSPMGMRPASPSLRGRPDSPGGIYGHQPNVGRLQSPGRPQSPGGMYGRSQSPGGTYGRPQSHGGIYGSPQSPGRYGGLQSPRRYGGTVPPQPMLGDALMRRPESPIRPPQQPYVAEAAMMRPAPTGHGTPPPPANPSSTGETQQNEQRSAVNTHTSRYAQSTTSSYQTAQTSWGKKPLPLDPKWAEVKTNLEAIKAQNADSRENLPAIVEDAPQLQGIVNTSHSMSAVDEYLSAATNMVRNPSVRTGEHVKLVEVKNSHGVGASNREIDGEEVIASRNRESFADAVYQERFGKTTLVETTQTPTGNELYNEPYRESYHLPLNPVYDAIERGTFRPSGRVEMPSSRASAQPSGRRSTGSEKTNSSNSRTDLSSMLLSTAELSSNKKQDYVKVVETPSHSAVATSAFGQSYGSNHNQDKPQLSAKRLSSEGASRFSISGLISAAKSRK